MDMTQFTRQTKIILSSRPGHVILGKNDLGYFLTRLNYALGYLFIYCIKGRISGSLFTTRIVVKLLHEENEIA
jgi:hypothetical protein